MNQLAEDLKFAITAQKAVAVETVHGKVYKCNGVREVNEAGNWVALWTPKVMGGDLTFERLTLSLISSVSVLDIDYPDPREAV